MMSDSTLISEVTRLKGENEKLKAQLAEAEARIEKMRKTLESFQEVILQSKGVYGYHLNGAEATWEWLLQTGTLEDLCAALAQPAPAEDDKAQRPWPGRGAPEPPARKEGRSCTPPA